MFRGRFHHTLDAKGRLRIPTRFREILQKQFNDQLIITNLDRCLIAYPLPEWEKVEEQVGGLSKMSPDIRAFQRFFISGATECSFDKQGRILIPQTLRDYAKLEREVVIAGVLKNFEIWSKPLWDEEIRNSQENFRQIAESVSSYGV
ncbi:MAG: division/cell wall cluster transcriptional repressor MraZ [Deltaproteobacteria bacterium]|nr:division/cell wall cluster transcriptional repressor MraZ [Deltaproteobacteria bacterium]MBW2071622.1 division/cell wall cluster transcriptional repressor MraZ [Deltaproteobacteria bacterium]